MYKLVAPSDNSTWHKDSSLHGLSLLSIDNDDVGNGDGIVVMGVGVGALRSSDFPSRLSAQPNSSVHTEPPYVLSEFATELNPR